MANYRKSFFDPQQLAGFQRTPAAQREDWAYDAGEGESGPARHFVFAEEAVLALNVALATRRPLLVSGEPGSGKTSLAAFASRALGRVFYRETITSRTQASDLLSSFDALRRLGDAQVERGLKPNQAYVQPGALWWALSPESAALRGLRPLAARGSTTPLGRLAVSYGQAPLADPGRRPPGADGRRAALLLDEIDKADPDVPNDLLESLDERRFTVPETGERIVPTRDDLLIVLTTNGERELPPAFLRRCVTLALPEPDPAWLIDIAERRFGIGDGPFQRPLYERLADEVMAQRALAKAAGRRPPSTSEFVDAVSACRQLLEEGWIGGSGEALKRLLDAVLEKKAGSLQQE